MHDFNFSEGELILVDKPLRWTSFDVVEKIKRTIGIRKLKIGHAGTLDPLACGLLILCTGKLTKQIDSFQAQEKEYQGNLILGASTPSYDLESEIDQKFDISHILPEAMQKAADAFKGEIEQISPSYSAMRVNGQRAYKMIRRGETPEIRSRKVHINTFEVSTEQFPDLQFRVVCSKGTYIRSLVHDYGKSLGSGAYLSTLRRTRIGEFRVENAWPLEELIASIRLFRGQVPKEEGISRNYNPKNKKGYDL